MSTFSKFDDFNRNQINVAICGAVSAGKSTLLNSIFVASYSDMKIKRTTMTPQVYFETNKFTKKESKEIKQKNTETNKLLYSKAPTDLTMEDIKENGYLVPKVKNLVSLDSSVYLTIYDIPGLNDSQTKHLYFQYLKDNFYKFDVILFVVDIHSALNTSDESDILEKILQHSKDNFEKYGIHKKLIVIANKCDEISVHENQVEFQDEELEEMYNQINTIIEQRVNSIYPEMEYTIIPLSSEDSYIYRMYDEDPSYELDLKHINKFGCNEYGRSRWNRLKDEQKKIKIKELMSKVDIEETLCHTGFTGFSGLMKTYLSFTNQYTFLLNHLKYGISNITDFNKLDISEEVQKYYLFFQRFKEINSSFSKHLGKKNCTMQEFHKSLNSFIENYKTKIVQQYIDIPTLSIKTSENLPQVEQIKSFFDEFSAKFNKTSYSINEILSVVTDSLNNFYVVHIKSKQLNVKSLLDYLYKLFTQKFTITSDLVKDIFSNNDMKNRTSQEVIEHLNSLEEKNLVNKEQKIDILVDFLKTVYAASSKGESFQNIPSETRGSYFFYADLFWSKLMLDEQYSSSPYYELAYLCKQNMCRYIGTTASNKFIDHSSDSIPLEMYFMTLIETHTVSTSRSKKIIKHSPPSISEEESDDETDYESDSGNLSEELNSELGL